MPDIPTPEIEVTRNIQMPVTNGEHIEVSMYGLRWIANDIEYGCSTSFPTPTITSDRYELMAIQRLLNEFVKWVNKQDG